VDPATLVLVLWLRGDPVTFPLPSPSWEDCETERLGMKLDPDLITAFCVRGGWMERFVLGKI
jgi:hypothetical protein